MLPLLLLPLALVLVFQRNTPATDLTQAGPGRELTRPLRIEDWRPRRVVVVIVDSLRPSLLSAESMPNLSKLAADGRAFVLHTCRANFTLPCIKTALEGRQSPVSSRLHNFTGVRGALDAVPVLAAAEGWPVYLYSDHTLDSLYGRHVRESHNVERAEGDPLDHDLQGFAGTRAVVEAGEPALVVVHTAGTDKAAHFKGVGTSEYFKHFRIIDAELGKLAAMLDPEKDALLVFGDHGHDDNGGHTLESRAVFWGNWSGLPERSDLDQTELSLFMNEALGVGQPASYEGRYWGVLPADTPRKQSFARATLQKLEEAGYTAPLENAIAQKLEAKTDRSSVLLAAATPPLLLWIMYVLGVLEAMRRDRDLTRRDLAPLVGTLAAMFLGTLESELASMVSVGLVGLGAAALVRGAQNRLPAFVLPVFLLLGLACGLAAVGMNYFNFFWAEGADPALNILLVFGGMILAGLGISWFVDRSTNLLPEGAGAAAALVLPSGAYFMNSGPNYFRGFLVGGLILLVWRWGVRWIEERKKPAIPVHALGWLGMLLVSVALLQWDRSANWTWQFLPTYYFAQVIPWVSWVLVILAPLLAGKNKPLWAFWGVTIFYSVIFAEMSVHTLAATSLMFFASMALLRLGEKIEVRSSGDWKALARPVLLGLVVLQTTWVMFDSFDINHLDFAFGYSYFGALQTEAQRFALYFALGFFKYALPVVFGVLLFCRGRGGRRLVLAASGFLSLKLAFLFAQVVYGIALSDEHVYEVALSEVPFVWFLALVLALTGLFSHRFRGGLVNPLPQTSRKT